MQHRRITRERRPPAGAEPNNGTRPGLGPVEERDDQTAPPGDVVPALARLLRKLRDRARADDQASRPPKK